MTPRVLTGSVVAITGASAGIRHRRPAGGRRSPRPGPYGRVGGATLYGDAEEPELAASLPLASVRWVVNTIPGRDVNLALMHGLEDAGYEGRAAVTAHLDLDHDRLRDAGADLVLRPVAAAAERSAAHSLRSG